MTSQEIPALQITGLTKQYPGGFRLGPVSLTLRKGTVLGFIGRNGAGKTTTLKALLNIVHPDGGAIRFLGKSFGEQELAVKQDIGFVSGGVEYYSKKKLRTITEVTRRFYPNWDPDAYRNYMTRFGLSEDKTPDQLSAGMKVKYALTLALSHRAQVLLLDEPTSGLDPISREEILDIFNDLTRNEGVSILFSTHITSDLEKSADDVAYLHNGRLLFHGPLKEFRDGYRLVRFEGDEPPEHTEGLIGLKREKEGYSALLLAGAAEPPEGTVTDAGLDAVIVHLEQEAKRQEEGTAE